MILVYLQIQRYKFDLNRNIKHTTYVLKPTFRVEFRQVSQYYRISRFCCHFVSLISALYMVNILQTLYDVVN